MDMYHRFFKRIIDLFFSILFLLILTPLFFFLSFLLLVINRGNPFFYQKRPGKDENIFQIIKFKTMNDKTDLNGNLLSDTDRLTKVGKFIRKTSLDEIPQLINVIKGDMSLIGPRPLLPQYIPHYTERERKRHSIRPGITGWAQVNGRNKLDWDTRLEMDVYYVENLSFILDVKIIFFTIKNVIAKKDIVVALDPQVNIPLNIYRNNDKSAKT